MMGQDRVAMATGGHSRGFRMMDDQVLRLLIKGDVYSWLLQQELLLAGAMPARVLIFNWATSIQNMSF